MRRINNSEIQTFKKCRRQWMLRYYLGYQPRTEDSKLFVGSLVHKGLEYYYSSRDIMQPIRDAEDAWFQTDNVLNVPEPSADIELAKKMLEGYQEWAESEGVDAHYKVVGLEEELSVVLPDLINGQQVELFGTVDLRLEDDLGGRGLLDHKTVQSFNDFNDRRLQLNEQLLTYTVLLRMAKDEIIDWAAINMLRKVKRTGATAKPPFFAREFVRFNVEQQRNHYKHLTGVIGDILRLEERLNESEIKLQLPEAYPTVTKDCTWQCPFLAICPLVDDGSDIEGALENLYKRSAA
jgi:hypothetical protein